MSLRQRIFALAGALVLVELAAYWKLSHWLFWTYEPWLAYTTSIAFVALLLAAIVALGSPMSETMRRQFTLGGIALFGVQALANVLMAYQMGRTALPADVVTGFFGVGPELALKAMATIQGATLSLVSISFWTILGEMLRSQDAERQQRRQKLLDFETILQEANHE